ncbi:CheR family methyltransferase [Sphingomonas sp. 1P06PA]|uniref:CheR family methyltransferase n=1 Tax=Sphingomonas sp. 1P06PA TaxID=554121 RepID=UPI0039A6B253
MIASTPSLSDDRELSAADFAVVARIAHAHAGIVLHEGKRMLVSSRLAKLVRQHDCANLRDYVQLISRDAAARVRAIEALTTNHTKFFREDHHFAHVEKMLRPAISARLQAGDRARLWSAGSSSGEEVYSLAMTLLGTDPAAGQRMAAGNLALLATDINAQMIAVGKTGQYSVDDAGTIPPSYARLWIDTDGARVTMRSELRRLVRFRQLNLMLEWPMTGQFDAIFCRNTMIYFDAPTNERLQCRLAHQLKPGGYLYIGHSERLLGNAASLLRPVGQTIFRKVGT